MTTDNVNVIIHKWLEMLLAFRFEEANVIVLPLKDEGESNLMNSLYKLCECERRYYDRSGFKKDKEVEQYRIAHLANKSPVVSDLKMHGSRNISSTLLESYVDVAFELHLLILNLSSYKRLAIPRNKQIILDLTNLQCYGTGKSHSPLKKRSESESGINPLAPGTGTGTAFTPTAVGTLGKTALPDHIVGRMGLLKCVLEIVGCRVILLHIWGVEVQVRGVMVGV